MSRPVFHAIMLSAVLTYLGLTIWALIAVTIRSPLDGAWQEQHGQWHWVSRQETAQAWALSPETNTNTAQWIQLHATEHGWSAGQGDPSSWPVASAERSLWRVIVSSWQR